MRYEDVPIGEVKVKERGRVDLGDIQSLADSFLQPNTRGHPIGILEPLVLDQNYNLLAGGRRLAAARLADFKMVPCVIRETPTKLDALEIELIENIARKDMTWQERARLEKKIYDWKSEHDPRWNQRDQAKLLEESKGAVSRRIQLAEALELLPELGEASSEDEAWKEYKKLEESYVVDELIKKAPEEVTQASKWASDHYQIGDALKLMTQVGSGIAHFAEVDPPYAVDLDKVKSRNRTNKMVMNTYNEVDRDEFETFFEKAATQVYRILKDDAFAVFWFGPTWHEQTRDILRKIGFTVPDIAAVWTKGSVGQTASPDTTFGSCYEPFWLARKGYPKLAKPGRSNVFDYRPISPAKKVHATEKPVALLEEIISSCTFPGSVILCPFLGSGVTLLASYKLGHTGWGYDLDKNNKAAFLRRVVLDTSTAQILGSTSSEDDSDAE